MTTLHSSQDLDVFTKPSEPRSDWETLQWLLFEPTLLQEYSKKISLKQTAAGTIRIYFKFIVPLIVVCWVAWITCLAAFHAPSHWFGDQFIDAEVWSNMVRFGDRWWYLFSKLAFDLAFGLAVGLAVGLAFGLAFGLAVGLAFGLAFGLADGLADGLAFGLAVSLAVGLAFGLAGGLADGLADGLAVSLAVGLAYGLAYGLCAFRVVLYPFYLFGVFRPHKLTKNPYLHDEGIWLPMPWVDGKLLKEARQQPETGVHFAQFLFRYRRLQRRLAFSIEHAATAGKWLSENQLRYETLKPENLPYFLSQENLDAAQEKYSLWDKINKPYLTARADYTPSEGFRRLLLSFGDALLTAENNTAEVAKKRSLESALKLLENLEQVLYRETFRRSAEYFEVVEHWKKLLKSHIDDLQHYIDNKFLIPENPYIKGDALAPEKGHKSIFLDREDVQTELELKIGVASTLPSLMILGQRRVGKTSLLNFLKVLLDKSRFRLAVLDAQSLSGTVKISVWLQVIGEKACAALDIDTGDMPKLPNDYLEAWDILSEFLLDKARAQKLKLILCIEEIEDEGSLYYFISKDKENGKRLLARMRSFIQKQSNVVLMFVGAEDFEDLPGEVRWEQYFVNLHRIQLDYLSKKSSLQLIQKPIPDFKLRYEEGVPEEIWELTQGHPHLIQYICSELVDYANCNEKNPLSSDDLKEVLEEKILQPGEQPFAVFWSQFCALPEMKKTVIGLACDQPIDPNSKEAQKLLRYKYAVKDETGKLRLRVPLFAEWVKKYGNVRSPVS